MPDRPYVPETITVHLGSPDSAAENVTVSFPDYIKNVASSEIYPTWPESAIRANLYAQISFALNRVYTEWYPSRGYPFDITGNTQYDQAYVQGRDVFENISRIADEIFNVYVVRAGNVEPLFARYCNGTTNTCEGLSQWGSVQLANQGLGAYDILANYFGNDIDLVSAPVRIGAPSYPGLPLRLGDGGNDVRTIQVRLNRISRNYPGIPKIPDPDGVFGAETQAAVRAFQRAFHLEQDGIVGKSTWYRIAYIFSSVKRLAELDSEGVSLEEVQKQYVDLLRRGDSGLEVRVVQYYLSVIGRFYEAVPPIETTGTFDGETERAVVAFQKVCGLTPDGIVGRATWNDIYRAYRGIVSETQYLEGGSVLFPGTILRLGSEGEAVTQLQHFLEVLAQADPTLPAPGTNGVFDEATDRAVSALQRELGLTVNGVVGPLVWDAIADAYSDLLLGARRREGQYPGYLIAEETREGEA